MRFFGRKKDEEKERRKEELKKRSGDEIFDEIFKRVTENKKKEGESVVGGQSESPLEEVASEYYPIQAPENQSESQEEFIEQVAPGRYRIKNPRRQLSSKEGGNERAKKVKPQNRDEILLEILKELRELNSNVRALIVRSDIGRQEIRELAEDIYARLKEKLDNMTMGMGG